MDYSCKGHVCYIEAAWKREYFKKYHQYPLYPAQGHGGPGACPAEPGCEGLLQGQFSVATLPTSRFLGSGRKPTRTWV